jgi:hypothetical protein
MILRPKERPPGAKFKRTPSDREKKKEEEER